MFYQLAANSKNENSGAHGNSISRSQNNLPSFLGSLLWSCDKYCHSLVCSLVYRVAHHSFAHSNGYGAAHSYNCPRTGAAHSYSCPRTGATHSYSWPRTGATHSYSWLHPKGSPNTINYQAHPPPNLPLPHFTLTRRTRVGFGWHRSIGPKTFARSPVRPRLRRPAFRGYGLSTALSLSAGQFRSCQSVPSPKRPPGGHRKIVCLRHTVFDARKISKP